MYLSFPCRPSHENCPTFILIWLLIFILLHFPETPFKTTNSSEYHTFYLKTASNIESLTQLWLNTNTSLLPHIFHLPNFTLTTTKNQKIARNKEDTYSLSHLPHNLKKKNNIYKHPHYSVILTNFLYQWDLIYKPPKTQCVFLVILNICITWTWFRWPETCNNPHILIIKPPELW